MAHSENLYKANTSCNCRVRRPKDLSHCRFPIKLLSGSHEYHHRRSTYRDQEPLQTGLVWNPWSDPLGLVLIGHFVRRALGGLQSLYDNEGQSGQFVSAEVGFEVVELFLDSGGGNGIGLGKPDCLRHLLLIDAMNGFTSQ